MDLLLNQKIEKLIDGRAAYTAQNLGFNLLISRLQKKYASNRIPAVMTECVNEVSEFLTKYVSIMTADTEKIKKI